MVTAYKISAVEAFAARRLIRVPSVILANLVLGENVVPEFLQDACTPERLAEALVPLIGMGRSGAGRSRRLRGSTASCRSGRLRRAPAQPTSCSRSLGAPAQKTEHITAR